MSSPPLTPGATLIIEFDTPEPCPIDFLGDTSDLVYFMSFAHTERYGSDHELAQVATTLKRQFRINMAPLLTFSDARTADPEEERALDMLWQDAKPLAECCRRLAEALTMDEKLRYLTRHYPELAERLQELREMADWASQRRAKMRLTYLL